MVKSKGGVEGDGDEVSIVSIGSLYNGPWEKKYWSSSRGKDRHPYPLGYKAVRICHGSTYEMEVYEGVKGPLFRITSSNGISCSRQTPDMTWKEFQKISSSTSRIWHGKRFSCKIGGAEFFGFKNTLVQRLLRELVTNKNETAEHSLVPSSFCNTATPVEHDTLDQDVCTRPGLLAKSVIRKKRSKRNIANVNLATRAGLDRPQALRVSVCPEALHPVHGNRVNHEGACSNALSASKEENNFGRPFSTSSSEVDIPAPEANELAGLGSHRAPLVANNLSEELDKVQDTEDKGCSFSARIECTVGDTAVSQDCQALNEFDLFAPDTLDYVRDCTTDSDLCFPDINTLSVKEETLVDVVISEKVVPDSHSNEVATTNMDSEKSDFDSAGQEITKSMMTLLLPQAIPLLKEASRRKKKIINPPELLSFKVNSQENVCKRQRSENTSTTDVELTEKAYNDGAENMQTKNLQLDYAPSNCGYTMSVAPDSLNDNQFGCQMTDQMLLLLDSTEANYVNSDQEVCSPQIQEEPLSSNAHKSSTSDVEAGGSKDIYSYDDIDMVQNVKLLEDDTFKTERMLGYICPSKRNSEQLHCINANGGRKSIQINNHTTEREIKTKLDSPEADASRINMGSFILEDVCAKTRPDGFSSCVKVKDKVYVRKKVKSKVNPTDSNSLPESSIICCVTETSSVTKAPLAPEFQQLIFGNDKFQGQSNRLETERKTNTCEDLSSGGAIIISRNKKSARTSEVESSLTTFGSYIIQENKIRANFDKELLVLDRLPVPVLMEGMGTSYSNNCTFGDKEDQTKAYLHLQRDVESNAELEGIAELVGCYFLPMPISTVSLSRIRNEIYICVSCCLLGEKVRTIFVYKIAVSQQVKGCPSFLGQTPVKFPFFSNVSGREIAAERSNLQFTPDGQYLVLLDSIKTPYCSEGRIDCQCLICTSHNDKMAVKIVQVKHGYVSVMVKLKTFNTLLCLLVCGPNYLIAAGEGGSLYLWVMNSTWRAPTEEYVIPANHPTSPCIIELKTIPKCAHLVVGHNGFAEFYVWDILKRVFISRFAARSTSIHQCFPIGVFGWHPPGYYAMEEHINRNMAATKMWFLEQSKKKDLIEIAGEDIAIWLMVSTVSDYDAPSNSVPKENPTRCWRLALLVNNMVIMGNTFDPRTVAVGSSFGHGIIGTCDGLVCMWELSSGAKLGTLHDFKGSGISCIVSDDSGSGIVGIASNSGQLLVYLHSQEARANLEATKQAK